MQKIRFNESYKQYFDSPEYYLKILLFRFAYQDFSDGYYTFEMPSSSTKAFYQRDESSSEEERLNIQWSHIDPTTGEVKFKPRTLLSFLKAVLAMEDRDEFNWGLLEYKFNLRKINLPEDFDVDSVFKNIKYVLDTIEVRMTYINIPFVEYISHILEYILIRIKASPNLTTKQSDELDKLFSRLTDNEV